MTEQELVKLAQSPEMLSKLGQINRWDLLPCLFRVHGQPFSLKDREPFQVLFDKDLVREKIVMSGRQCGKCLQANFYSLRDCYGAPLHDPKPGDKVLSFDSQWRAVPGVIKSVFRPGKKKVLRIVTEKGNELHVSPEHKVRQLDGFVEAGSLQVGSRIASMRRGGVFGDYVPEPGRVEATAYMLGNGSCRGYVRFTSMFQFCLDELAKIAGEGMYHFLHKKGTYARDICFKKGANVTRWMDEDGLNGCLSCDKFIPDWVFRLSREDTILFMSRLWSTDGRVSLCKDGFADISYCTTSKALCDGVRALLFKLGYMNAVRIKHTHYKRPDGARVKCKDAYIIRLETFESQSAFLDEVDVPCRPRVHLKETFRNNNRDTLPKECNAIIKDLFSNFVNSRRDSLYSRGLRMTLKYPPSVSKVAQYLDAARSMGLSNQPEYYELRDLHDGDVYFDAVKSIENIGDVECYDLEIEQYHNFMLDNICVHNSMSLSRSQIFDLLSIQNYQLLYVAPLQEQTRRYSDLYINETIQSCPLAMKLQQSSMAGKLSDAKIINATFHKSFANGSGIQLGYAQTSANRLRGIMADGISVDECQSVSGEVIPIIQESLTSSKFGVTTYTGTAMTTENLIEAKWQKSSQCEWVMKCQHCGTWAIPNLDGGVLKMIQSDGIHCLHCGARLDVLQGRWVAAFPDRMMSFRGYHIPQVICPFIVNNKNNWDKLLHKLLNGVLATFIQENLGISYSVGQRLITMQHLQRQCVLPSTKTLQDEIKRNPHRYSMIVAGIDWGGAELTSFTVITVIGIRPNGRIDVLWARRYRGFDPDEQMEDIARICKFYGVTACAADAGMGLDKNQILSKRFGIPIVQIQYTRQLKLFGKNQSRGRTNAVQCWTIDKVMALDILFLAIRNRRIFFPKESAWQESFLPDILSPFESTTEVGGMTHRLYLRSEAQPDDFCHALCFASMVAMKLMGMAVDDMIPPEAFGGGQVDDEAPDSFGVSTKEE